MCVGSCARHYDVSDFLATAGVSAVTPAECRSVGQVTALRPAKGAHLVSPAGLHGIYLGRASGVVCFDGGRDEDEDQDQDAAAVRTVPSDVFDVAHSSEVLYFRDSRCERADTARTADAFRQTAPPSEQDLAAMADAGMDDVAFCVVCRCGLRPDLEDLRARTLESIALAIGRGGERDRRHGRDGAVFS